MPRPTKPLKLQYGRLTVVSEFREEGSNRRYAHVRCACGKEKDVLADALLASRTRSCGSFQCRLVLDKRVAPKFKPKKGYRPNGSRKIPLDTLRSCWVQHTGRDAVSGEKLGKLHDINTHTLYSAFRAIRLAGGWDEYVASIRDKEERRA